MRQSVVHGFTNVTVTFTNPRLRAMYGPATSTVPFETKLGRSTRIEPSSYELEKFPEETDPMVKLYGTKRTMDVGGGFRNASLKALPLTTTTNGEVTVLRDEGE